MKAHDSLCPKTWGRDQCWCDLYKSSWKAMYESSYSHDWRSVLMLRTTYVDGGVSC